jgi:hypothetical protein
MMHLYLNMPTKGRSPAFHTDAQPHHCAPSIQSIQQTASSFARSKDTKTSLSAGHIRSSSLQRQTMKGRGR